MGKKSKVFLGCLMIVIALLFLFPVIWIVSTSFKTETEVLRGGMSLIPQIPTLESFRDSLFNPAVAKQMPILRWVLNSVIVAVAYTGINLLVSSMSAFAFARLEFKGRNVLFMLLLTTMMVPPIVTMVPLYKMMVEFKWVNTLLAMIFPGTANALAMFLIRQFMEGIPKDLDEAARIDGAGLFKIYSRVIMPICKPAVIVSGLFVMLGNWNDFLWPSIVTNSVDMRTLPAGLRVLQAANQTSYVKLAVAAVVSAVPIFIIYLFAQKYFIKGISMSGGVKG